MSGTQSSKIEKRSNKIFVMINKYGGGGQFLDFMEGHSVYEWDTELKD